MADQNTERDIFGPSETKPGTSGQTAGSDMDASGAEQTHATGIDHEIADQEWGRGHDMGTSTHDISGTGMTGEAQSKPMQSAEELRRKPAPTADQAKQQAAQAMDQVQERAYGMLDQQKNRAADTLGTVAGALHNTGDHLHEQNQGAFGQYAHRAADAVDRLSRQLNEKGLDELVHEAEDFARREPQIFLGGALLAGILLARFLKSSAPEPEYRSGYYGQGYRPGGSGQYGRSFERGGMGYTRRERGGIEQTEREYDESWPREDFYPPTSTGPIS